MHRASGVDHGSIAVQANNEIAGIRRVVVLDRVLLVKLHKLGFREQYSIIVAEHTVIRDVRGPSRYVPSVAGVTLCLAGV